MAQEPATLWLSVVLSQDLLPLLVLKGIYHYWTYLPIFSSGLKQMDVWDAPFHREEWRLGGGFFGRVSPKKSRGRHLHHRLGTARPRSPENIDRLERFGLSMGFHPSIPRSICLYLESPSDPVKMVNVIPEN